MAYNENFPADDSYLSDFPAGDREQNRALKDDQIVNAGQLQGLTAGNENGQIPINNGTENTNLNAALLNGKASSYFATSNHTHDTATQSSNGYMSNADKKKLDGIASGAEVNQNAFANVKVGSTTIQSDTKQDTLELVAGTNISLVGDANNDKVTIGVTGKVASASQADNATNATKATQDGNGNTIATHYLSRTQTTKNDMNTCTTEGIYRFSGTLSNAWTGTSWGTLLVLNNQYNGGSGTSGVYLVQLAFPTDNTIRMRQRVNTGAWTSWVTLARTSDNVASATKATQDSAGQTINTTYVKGVSASNATLTITKGNGSTSTITVNNVANATKATQDSDGQTINSTYLKRSGGTMTGVLTMGTGTEVQIKAPNNTGFYFNSGALGCYNWSGTNGGSIFAYSPSSNTFTFAKAVTAPTPGTSDNSTRVATTAFVQSLINSLKGSIGGTIVASNLAQNGYVKFSNGLILQWGSYPRTGGNINYPISFTTKVYAISSTSALDYTSTDLSNLSYLHIKDTNYGTPSKVNGWYIAIGV